MEQVKSKRSTDHIYTHTPTGSNFYSQKNILAALIFTVTYLLLAQIFIGFQTDQVVLVVLFNTLFFTNRATRQWILAFSTFLLYWIIFDFMKGFPNHYFNQVNIESLYNTEKRIFGINVDGNVLTPNEYFLINRTQLLDFLSGLFYLCWIPVPLIFAIVIYFKNKNYYFQFALTFLLVNFIGFFGYYLYPAAPPWYVSEHGFQFLPNTPGNTAGLQYFDKITGLNIFEALYAKSSNVFAAMPSMHAAYMLLVCFYSIKMGLRRWVILFAIITMGIWFGAVYTSHHYIIDIIAGIATAISGFLLFQYLLQTNKGKRIFSKLLAACKY